jgi:hypothetical protein
MIEYTLAKITTIVVKPNTKGYSAIRFVSAA